MKYEALKPEYSTRAPLALINPVLFSPFCLLRIAALPFAQLMALRTEATLRLLEDIRGYRRELEQIRAAVEDALHSLVPGLAEEETRLRRQVINLKRDIHNGRPVKISAADLDEIAQRLPVANEKYTIALATWRRLRDALARAEEQVEQTFARETQEVLRKQLRAPLDNSWFQHALAYGSPGVARSAASEKKLPTKATPDNLERSLLGYLIRAAAKTSPFSSFMLQTAVRFAPGLPQQTPRVADARVTSRTRLNRGITKRLHRAYCAQNAAAINLPLRINETLSKLDETGRVQGICNRDLVLLGRPWCDQRYAQFRLDGKLAALITGGPSQVRWNDFADRLVASGIPRAQTDALMKKLLARGIFSPPPFTQAYDAEPEQQLQEFIASHACAEAPELIQLLTDMRGHVDHLKNFKENHGVEDTQQMLHSLEQIRALETRAMGALGQQQYDEYQNMVLEDCWVSGVEGHFGSELASDLQGLADFLSTQVAVSVEYDRMRSAFTTAFGAGGSCDKVMEFLLSVGNKLIDVPEFGAKPVYVPPKAARPGTPIGVTAQIQLARDPRTGEKLIVVNRVFNGLGWLSSRFGFGAAGEQDLLRDSLAQWLATAAAPKEPVDLILNGDCNDLQAHPRLTRRALAWPGEPLLIDAAERIHPTELVLRHNPDSDLLELFDRDGKAIDLQYLGSTFPSPSWGVPYALSILTQPFQLLRPDMGPPAADAATDKPVIFKPRISHGNTILRRGVWWVKSSYLKQRWFAAQGAQRLLAVMEELDGQQLPEWFFAQKTSGQDGGAIGADALDADRKPLWVDAKNPFCLALLERICEKSEWISFTEALPGPADHWLQMNTAAHVTELQVEMVVRARQEQTID